MAEMLKNFGIFQIAQATNIRVVCTLERKFTTDDEAPPLNGGFFSKKSRQRKLSYWLQFQILPE